MEEITFERFQIPLHKHDLRNTELIRSITFFVTRVKFLEQITILDIIIRRVRGWVGTVVRSGRPLKTTCFPLEKRKTSPIDGTPVRRKPQIGCCSDDGRWACGPPVSLFSRQLIQIPWMLLGSLEGLRAPISRLSADPRAEGTAGNSTNSS